MKVTKRLLAALLSVAMLLAMAVPAFAADAAATTYTISVASGDTHTYSVYQILTGDLSEGVLSNIKAGSNFNANNGKGENNANLTATELAEKLTANGFNTQGQALANLIAEYVTGDAVGTVSSSSSLSVVAGYYLIKDNGAASGTTEAYSTNIVKVVNNVEITPKKAVPTFEKKVKDADDTAGTVTGWQDSADYDIGDAVPFQLKGTIPTNYDSYSTYYYQFTDQMEKSLTFNKDSVKVYVDNTEITTGFTVSNGSAVSSSDSFNEGTSFTVTFENLKNVTSVKASSTITVEYNATLNSNAVLGNQGNVNEAKLKYSNNPNKGGEGDKGETPWDAVIVFTYQTVVNKVDQDKKPLTGAEFTLYKKVKNSSGEGTTEVAIQAVKAASGTQFTFKGLDDGDYVLKETKTPDGYNTAADIEFTITATHAVEWSSGARTTILTELKGGSLGDGKVDTGTITTQVENRKGSTLPETGGIGTTIFYVVGGCMMFGAAVLLITKKRMENN